MAERMTSVGARPLYFILWIACVASYARGSLVLRKETPLGDGCSEAEYQNLSSAVKDASERLNQLIQTAEAKGVNCSYERLSLRVAAAFTKYAAYDFAHPDNLIKHERRQRRKCCRRLRHMHVHDGQSLKHHDCLCTRTPNGSALACTELYRTQKVLADATAELQTLLSNEHLNRLPVPNHNMLGVEEQSGYFFRPETGKPVFPGGYDQGIWKYFYGFPDDQETDLAVSLGHNSDELSISIATVMPVNETYVNETFLDFLKSRLDYFTQFSLAVGIYTGCQLPDWAKSKYPDLPLFMASNCAYNLDVPELAILWNRTLTAVYSHLHTHPGLHSFRLGNEVWYGIFGNRTRIPQVTMDRWYAWLEKAYSNNLTRLNELYDTKYTSFKSVPIGKMQGGSLHPIVDKGHVSITRDVALFLESRSFAHYQNMIAALKSVNASVKTHVKFVNKAEFSSWPDSGVYRLAINDLTTWVGCDTRIMPNPVQQISTPNRDHLQYALDWLPAAIGYTFMRTTAGNKVVVDQEVHPITTSRNQNSSIAFGHLSAAMWVAHLHGLSMNLIWSWGRFSNGSASDSVYASLLTQPQTLNDYARSMDFINAVAEEVHALANGNRPICLFYNGVSKQVNEKQFFYDFIDTFEALEFFGPQTSMVTDFMLNKNSSCLKLCQLFIVPKTSYIDQVSLSAIAAFYKSGSKVLFIDDDGVNKRTEARIFAYNEIGEPYPESVLQWTKQVQRVTDQKPKTLLTALLPHLQSVHRDVQCVDQSTSKPTWGLMCRCATVSRKSTGKMAVVLALLNTLTVPVKTSVRYAGSAELPLAGPTLTATNLYMNQTVDLSTISIQPLQVLILQLNV